MSIHNTASLRADQDAGGGWRGWIQRHERLSFYLLVPLFLCVAIPVLRIGMAAIMPLPVAIGMNLLLVLPVWLVTAALTSVAHRLLAPWRPPLWVLCLVASFAQALVLSPYYRWLFSWMQAFVIPGASLGTKLEPQLSAAYLMTLAAELAPGALIWMATNYLFDRGLGIARYRYRADVSAANYSVERVAVPSPASVQSKPFAPPAFMTKSRLPADSEVAAITAEEHYIRVVTDRGSDLIRCRFSDALAELADVAPGMQVHRSWWVRLDRVVSTTDRNRSLQLTLADGTVVPVSLAFREAVLRSLSRRKP